MEMIQGAEWVVVAIFLTATLAGLFLVVSAQGDMNLREERGQTGDDQAATMFIDLINKTRNSLVIHDDGNDFGRSVYNNDRVVTAMRDRMQQRRQLKVKCLFDARAELKLLELADGECKDNISVWYASSDRPKNDIHYKIVDGGRLVHLSVPEHGASERAYVLRKAEPWWAARTRRRISRPYLDHFEYSLVGAETAGLRAPGARSRVGESGSISLQHLQMADSQLYITVALFGGVAPIHFGTALAHCCGGCQNRLRRHRDLAP